MRSGLLWFFHQNKQCSVHEQLLFFSKCFQTWQWLPSEKTASSILRLRLFPNRRPHYQRTATELNLDQAQLPLNPNSGLGKSQLSCYHVMSLHAAGRVGLKPTTTKRKQIQHELNRVYDCSFPKVLGGMFLKLGLRENGAIPIAQCMFGAPYYRVTLLTSALRQWCEAGSRTDGLDGLSDKAAMHVHLAK